MNIPDFNVASVNTDLNFMHLLCCYFYSVRLVLCRSPPWGRSSTSAVKLRSSLSFMKEHKFILWFMASCSLVGGHQHFRETCSPHFQGRSELSWEKGRLYKGMTGQCKPGMIKWRQVPEQATEGWGMMFLKNVSAHLPDYMLSWPRSQYEPLLPWRPQIPLLLPLVVLPSCLLFITSIFRWVGNPVGLLV